MYWVPLKFDVIINEVALLSVQHLQYVRVLYFIQILARNDYFFFFFYSNNFQPTECIYIYITFILL